jgi:hypothetical protein
MPDILIKLLDWPFLAFVFLFAFILIFRRQIKRVLDRGDITISWGENRSIRLRDLSESLDEEFDPLHDEIEALKEAVSALQAKAQVPSSGQIEPMGEQLSEQARKDALRRMKNALTTGKWRWRSIERLAVIGAVTESQAIDILRSDPEVVLSRGKSGNQIARLKSR